MQDKHVGSLFIYFLSELTHPSDQAKRESYAVYMPSSGR